MRTISREVAEEPCQATSLTPQRLHAELLETSVSGTRAYLLGALHDGTMSHTHRTIRFGQSDRRWLEVIRELLGRLGQRSWLYREGRDRDFWVVETSDRWLDDPDPRPKNPLAYARGYFDAEGGVPRNAARRFYVQYVPCRAIVLILRRSARCWCQPASSAAASTTRVGAWIRTCGGSTCWRDHIAASLKRSDRGTRGNAVCWRTVWFSWQQDEEIVHASWRHGDQREQGSRSGSCGWITSFLGRPRYVDRAWTGRLERSGRCSVFRDAGGRPPFGRLRGP